jgi:hypothetical protein
VDEGGSVDEVSLSLSEEAPWGSGGILVTGDPGGYVKKFYVRKHPSLRGPHCRRETRYAGVGGRSYTEDLDK